MRRCPKCHSTGDDQYGFCIKCGYEYPKIEATPNTCPLCAYENPEEADYCVKCGSPLIFKNQGNNPENPINPIVIRRISNDSPDMEVGTTSKILILFGYIFSILGGLLGLIIAIYLVTRRDPVAKKHGRIQLAIFVFYLVLILIFILTGAISTDNLMQYSQMNLTNLTNVSL